MGCEVDNFTAVLVDRLEDVWASMSHSPVGSPWPFTGIVLLCISSWTECSSTVHCPLSVYADASQTSQRGAGALLRRGELSRREGPRAWKNDVTRELSVDPVIRK
jgi:hypothetical protein